jgi:hypothetical protein
MLYGRGIDLLPRLSDVKDSCKPVIFRSEKL